MTTTGASLTRLRCRSRSPQAGLPLDKFRAVDVEAAPGLDEDAEFVLRTDKVCLVFRTDEETFIDAVKGQHHLGQVLEAGHHRMIQDRSDLMPSGAAATSQAAHD